MLYFLWQTLNIMFQAYMTKQANKISSAQQTIYKNCKKNKSGKYRTEHFPCGIVFIILTYAQTFIICLPFISNIFLF